jgi:hypothetical protein
MYQTHYAVTAFCPSSEAAAAYLDWLVDGGHLRDVLEAGAESARAIRLDPFPNAPPTPIRVVSVYTFKDRSAFEAYEREHAPRLRAEGLEKFKDVGLRFQREIGEIVCSPEAVARE